MLQSLFVLSWQLKMQLANCLSNNHLGEVVETWLISSQPPSGFELDTESGLALNS